MKYLLIIVGLLYSLNGFAQRYLTDDFPVLDSIIGSSYGTAIDYESNIQDLLFDFYEPSDDVLEKRPLIIYLHGGGFTTGSRTYPSVAELCRRMAKKGYVVANIDYRLDPDFEFYNSNDDRRAMTDAMHDAKQAIRYFKANANTFRIDTSLIFIGGESAGAVTSMMASFVDKQSEMNVYPMANPNDPIGSQENLNVSNQVKGALCLCGTILDTLAMELPTDPSILWIHGTDDSFVPIAFAFNVVLRAVNIGIPIEAKAYQGAIHCPWYFGNPDWALYLDSTVVDITNFLYPQVTTKVSSKETQEDLDVLIYPNPFQNHISIKLGATNSQNTIKLFSNLGELIFQKVFDQFENEFTLSLENIEIGYYILLIENDDRWMRKKVFKL